MLVVVVGEAELLDVDDDVDEELEERDGSGNRKVISSSLRPQVSWSGSKQRMKPF